MREVTAALRAAIDAPTRTVRPRVSVDWRRDGYGGGIDDVSAQVAGMTVAATLTGTQPEQVNVVEGVAAPTLAVDLSGTSRMDAVRYFSVFADDSPLAGLERVGLPVTASVEFDTGTPGADRWQQVPLFAGQVRGLPVNVSDGAHLSAVDAARQALRLPVALPAMAADVPTVTGLARCRPGLSGSWVASYLLTACGFPPSPPAPPGCVLHVPMHGSAMPFVSRPFVGSPASEVASSPIGASYSEVTFTEGPFLLATAIQPIDRYVNCLWQPQPGGATVFQATGRSAGRFELWVRATADMSGQAFSLTQFANPFVSTYSMLYVGDNLLLDRSIAGSAVTITGPRFTLPTTQYDGLWHQVGVAWDDAQGLAVFVLDGTLHWRSYTPPATTTGIIDDWYVQLIANASLAELAVSAGQALTDPFTPYSYDPPAVVDVSGNALAGIVPGLASEAWSRLVDLAAAEQGAMFVDQDGRPHWSTRRQLVSDHAQQVQRDITARSHLFDLAYDLHLDKVANIVSCDYQPIAVVAQAEAWRLGETVSLEPGQSAVLRATFTGLASAQRSVLGTANTLSSGAGTSTNIGTGFIGAVVAVTLAFTSDTTAEITVTNTGPNTLWLVGTDGQPNLALVGDVLSQGQAADPATVTVAASVALYGPQLLPLPASPWIQTRSMAAGIAMATAGDLAYPAPVWPGLPIPGDPTLEPYDRLRLVDAQRTGVEADVWHVGATHTIDAANHYVTTVAARPARNRYLAGTGLAGVDLVG